ncbi:UDP-N-acetylhexosamine pyrophosphorylase-like isoform X2 [Saccostrea cucullata]|uniref:UDP-N-acetylhexosamine pyrophosphorylase-like isoform X2 n=1 Tax=Saccostrea cuccullata TaxID=36930 RepID=UPI002ED22083
MDIEGLKARLAEANQEHLLKYWDQLSDEEKQQLYAELSHLDFKEINGFFKAAMEDLNSASEKLDDLLEPLPKEVWGGVVETSEADLLQYDIDGLTEIGESRVAVILLAGGQGTRLGVPYPKGMYNVGLPSGKTLYQIQAERLLKLQRLGEKVTGNSCKIPWYIMTSEHTKNATLDFFKKNNYFGLEEEDVVLFEQNLLPCIGFDGKIILEKPHKVALAPDGNGGLYRALNHSGVLKDMEKRGIKYIHVYCVDNILVKMADPIFIGFCLSKGATCGAKVVEKTFPTEPVGVVCKVEGKYQVVEYSEITQKTAEKRDSNGRLVFNAGNICNHFFTLDLLKFVSEPAQEKQMKHHVAKKKIPHVSDKDSKVTIKPDTPNGIKMEKFVFDVFHFATSFAVWEVIREDEFAPLKNADTADKDTPTTCRRALLNLHHRYLLAAGAQFVDKDGKVLPPSSEKEDIGGGDCKREDQDVVVECEISPLVSYAGEGLKKLVEDRTFSTPVYLDQDYTMEEPEIVEGEW